MLLRYLKDNLRISQHRMQEKAPRELEFSVGDKVLV